MLSVVEKIDIWLLKFAVSTYCKGRPLLKWQQMARLDWVWVAAALLKEKKLQPFLHLNDGSE